MNQEEEVPTRVTRGALRRRSIDQDATPQNPQGTGTGVAGGTPKKAASAAKKGSTLGAIQESQGRPSTPVGGGRGTRRRMSETNDTPTTATNKLVQSLKDSESVVGSGPGRRSRNTSLTLTEENVQELNAANEGTGATVRTRTPARLRASHETLTSTTPQTAPTGVRRSTRRNSVTSDDGSVQSLPITTPKTPIGRPLKVEPIVEEDMTGGDRAGSDSSPRNTPGRASTPRTVSQSPRGEAPSPLLTVKQEMTPPRGSVSPQQSSSSARKTPNSTPRSKNVSFTDDSKQEDHQSGYPKTPTSPGKKFVLVGVNDLRNTQLINGTPKANAVIVLGGSDEKAGTARNEQVTVSESPTVPAVGEDSAGNDASDATAEVEGKEKKDADTIAPSSATENVDAGTPADSAVPLNISSSIPSADRSVVAASNEVSGIDALESSVLEDVVNTSNVSNGQTTEGESFSKYWSHSVRGTTTKGIDAFSVRKQEEKKAEEEQKKAEEEQKNLDTSQQRSSKTPEKKIQPSTPESDEEEEAEEEQEDDERDKRHEFADDEAMEVDGYQSGDSLDAEIRQEMAEHEIADQGEDLGTDDTEDDVEDGEQEDENDSFIVTDDDDEELDEDALLAGSGDDLSMDGSPAKTPKEKTPSHRRRIVQMVDDSEEEEEEAKKLTTPSSSERSRSERKRSVKQLTTTDEEASPEKKPNQSVMTEDEEESAVVMEGKDELADEQERTPEKLDNTSGEAKKAATPAKAGKPSETETPSKAADVSVKSVRKSPGQSVHESDSSFAEVFSHEKTDVSEESATKNDEESTKTAAKSVSFEATSRKSLPPVASSKESGKAVARKSLPAGTKMQFVEEVTTEELHPSTSNLEASYQEEEDEIEDGKQQKEKNDEQKIAMNGEDQEGAEKTSSITVTSDEEYYEASESVNEGLQTDQGKGQKHVEGKQAARDKAALTEEQSVAPVKPARKALPAAPLISAQFYLGGSKKEKRNTDAVSEEAPIGVTSTPNQKPSAKKNKKSAVSSNLVANPFAALASAKAKTRLSMDSAVAGPSGDPDDTVQTVKKNRNSLPVMKLDAAGSDSKSKAIASVAEEAEDSPQQYQQPLDEPEPMEVDESDEEEGQTNEAAGDDKQSEQKGAVGVKPKTPKKKPKALTEYDLESILTRCNEVVRADKERKKQFATLAQQKRDEKRRLRELREQQEKLESSAVNGEGQQQRNDGADDETKSNITTTANEESIGQPSSDDPAKKKKKRKKKVKNYMLEELAELKKDRVSEALLRKMEAIEERKQRKKERRAEKMKLLNKENGDVRGGAPDGIGAKLEKVAKKKQKQRKEIAAAEEELKQQPSVRVAVSAFAVFQQLQNGHTTLQPAMDGPLGDGKKHTKIADVEALPVTKSVEKQEPLEENSKESAQKLEKKQPKKLHLEDVKETVVADVLPKKEHPKVAGKKKDNQPDEPKKTPEEKKPSKEKPTLLVAKTPTADDVTAIKKKKKAEGKAAATESAEVQKAASESQLGQRETDVSAEKLKRKQKKTDVVAAAAVDVVFAAPEADPLPQEETRKTKKSKKNKIDNMAASVEEDSKTEVVKEKKRVPAAEFFVVPEAEELEPLHQEESRKTKKQKKNKAGKTVVPVEEEIQDIVEPLPPKESKKANKKGALAKASVANGGLEKKKLGTNKPKEEESIVTSALREIRAVMDESKKNKKTSKDKKGKKKAIAGTQDDAVVVAAAIPPKKRKRDPLDGSSTSSTPRPTKLRALQRADLGFVEETVTPDKTRLKRNFGFEEVQATPKAVGFKVSSLLPTDDLRTLADDATQRKKLKKTGTVPEPNRSLPLPVWTRSGYFIEVPDKESERPKKKTQESKKKPNATAGGGAASSYIPLKGHEGFKLGTLRGMPNGGGTSSSAAATTKPHRINPDTVAPSVVSFKRQQLLEKTAHLREKKKGGRL
uniref:Uncharacterized protein n=1 Tax=Anopheles atroparvus TaxID=41427 RepID=A0AAG5CTL1_ANOAO